MSEYTITGVGDDGLRDDDGGDRKVHEPKDPLRNARAFVSDRYHHCERPLLVCQGNTFFAWDGACWPEVEDASLRSDLYRFFDTAVYDDGGIPTPFKPTRHKVSDLLDALKAAAHLPVTVPAPAWLDGPGAVPADELVPARNGLVHVPTRQRFDLTPRLFVHHAVPFDYDPDAPAPERWLRFLHELWPVDPTSIETLQEMFGYIVSGDTRQQKMFLLVGPKRAGKGTIARVLAALIGTHNTTGVTLAGLSTNFGLQDLIGKPLAVVSDARLRADDSVVTERLLSISGEDLLTVDRKYRDPWTGKLPTRFLICTNELPRLVDSSGALTSRFVLLTLTNSFFGAENPDLTADLTAELAGIFNWALDGLERLRDRGRFVQPETSEDALRELEDLGSPISAFLRDCCEVGVGHSIGCGELYQAWRSWCSDHGRDRPGTAQTFGRDLRAAVPGLRVTRPREDGRQRQYEGIRLRHNNGLVRGPLRTTDAQTGTEPGPVRDGPRSGPLLSQQGPQGGDNGEAACRHALCTRRDGIVTCDLCGAEVAS